MKRLVLLPVLLIVLTIRTNAQIPNNGFETWEVYEDNLGGCTQPFNIYQKPDMWNGSLPKSCQTHSYSIQKNNESYPAGTGQFSLKIQPDIANGVRGVAISNDGSDSMINWIPQPAFEIKQRPTTLNLYYKYLPHGGDTMIVQVYFYKKGVVIGNSIYGTTDTVEQWKALEIPMTYKTSDIPDSATIFFVTGAYVQHSESILYIDNVSFDGFVTSIKEVNTQNIAFNLFPNPSSGELNISITNKYDDNLILNIYNSLGTLIKSQRLKQNERQINIRDLKEGVYFVEINSKKGIGRLKLLIQ